MDSVWFQLLIEFFGAFLGFLFAALLSSVSERRETKNRYKMILNSLINELNDIVEPMKQYIASNTVLKARIAVPAWDALQYSGMTLQLLGKEYFDDLITAYAKIKAYNEDRLYDKTVTVDRMADIVSACEKTLAKMKAERK